MRMGKRWKWVLAGVALLPLILAATHYILRPKSYEFRLQQTSRIDVLQYNPSPGRLLTLTNDPAEIAEIINRITLRPMERCCCAFGEEYIFRSPAGDVEIFMSDHAFIVGGAQYHTPPGVFERIQALVTRAAGSPSSRPSQK